MFIKIIFVDKNIYLFPQERQEELNSAMATSSQVSPRAKASLESLERAKRELSSHCDAIKLSLANLNRAKEWQFNENSPSYNPSPTTPNESLNGSFKSGEYTLFFISLHIAIHLFEIEATTCWLIACSISTNEMRVWVIYYYVLHVIYELIWFFFWRPRVFSHFLFASSFLKRIYLAGVLISWCFIYGNFHILYR